MARQPVVSNLQTAALYQVNPDGTLNTSFANSEFMINPDTWEDNKSNTGWVPNMIPGQSLPVYQWVAGGPRIISFEALVTKDTSYFNTVDGKANSDLASSLATKGLAAVGSIASSFLGVQIPAGQIIGALLGNNKNAGKFNLDISDMLDYYRSMYLPTYDGTKVILSPPLVYLYSGIDLATATIPSSIDKNSEVFMVTNLGIKITKQLPDLSPMEAIVSFQLEQYGITPPGNQLQGTPRITVL